ncbi:TetR/AcrR family transcriptional regulator [Geothrix terrae]|uniref:TetR/AcrR family transcriptional regulator n=1 Tax=Geothrix terrae TaxID=2922720 RepID=UPI001FAC09F2|nr:TetR/AcrR family transcriptional regulator [Geothrix terrae]
MAKKPDRRVERTRQLLRSALFSLVKEKGFEGLSVQEIIDRANVGRATFYAHFDNKEDLLVSGFDDLQAALKARQQEALAQGKNLEEQVFAFSRDLFVHAGEHRDIYRAMAGRQSGGVIRYHLHKLLTHLIREDLKIMLPHPNADSVPREALVQHLAGGSFGLLMWWLDSRKHLPVEEVEALFRNLAMPAVKAATDHAILRE